MLQEEGFKLFLQRPENRAVLEEHQRKEARRAEKLAAKQQALSFRDKVSRTCQEPSELRCALFSWSAGELAAMMLQLKERFGMQVLEADYSAQRNVAPFLKIPVLRRIVQTFTNDEHEDFGRWAHNPLAIQMLQQAKDLLDEGRMTEAEMEALLLSQMQARNLGRLGMRQVSKSSLQGDCCPEVAVTGGKVLEFQKGYEQSCLASTITSHFPSQASYFCEGIHITRSLLSSLEKHWAQAPGCEAWQDAESKSERTVRLTTDQLVPALNEHVR